MSSDYPLEIKYHRLWEWLDARSSVLSKKKDFKDVRSKAVTLAQLVRHEAAGLRKHIQKAKRDVVEGERREELHGAAARRAERDLQQLCAEYGVDPHAADYAQAVGCHAAASLASRVAAVAAALPADAAPSARVYAAFVAAERREVGGGGGGGGGGGDADGSTLAELLPTLAFVLEHSTHHTARVCLECLRTKRSPTEEEVAAAEAAAAVAAVAAKGEGATGAEEAAAVESRGDEVIEVDWGMLMHDGGGADNADNADGFCCELVEEEEGTAADNAASPAAADGEDCPLLLSSECRTLLLDDLHELLGFLEQRQEEGDIRAAAGVAGVGAVVALLEDDVLHELVDVAASGAALQRAAQRLARKRTEAEKMAQACLRDRDSVHDATERQERAAARLAEISLEAKPLKAEIEERMCVWHAPRVVYLVGDVEHI